MQPYRLYKHIRGRDVAIMPGNLRPVEGGFKTVVKYYNLASPGRAPWSMGIMAEVFISHVEYDNYVDITNLLDGSGE